MRGLRFVLRLLLVPGLALVGGLVGYGAEGLEGTAALLLWEPALWVVAAWAGWGLVARGHRGLAMGLASGGVAATLAVHLPAAPAEPEGVDAAPFVASVRSCVRALSLPAGPVRLLQWTVSGDSPALPSAVADAHPDVAVIFGPVSAPEVDALRAAVGDEALELPGEEAPIHVFARGAFSLCGEADQWVDRPAPGVDVGFVFVGLEGGSTFPLLVARFPEVGAEPGWAAATAQARGALRATVETLQSSTLIAALSVPAPLAAPRLARTLGAVGLAPMARPLDWPTWSPLRLHTFDQVWGAEAWVSVGWGTVRADATRDGVLADLAPRWPISLPAAGDDDPVR